MAFSMNLEPAGEVTVVVLDGYVDKPAARQVCERVTAERQAGRRRFVIDFERAPLVNSSALAELIDLVSQNIQDGKLRFVFCGLSPTCRFSFNTVGIFLYAQPVATRAEAVALAAQP